MKVPFSWLTELCDPGLPAEEVADLLSMRAVDVERVTRRGVPSADGFVVARVLAAEQHPNADRLRVCEVDTGAERRTIVCGAPNVAAGQAVAVALPGATMPGGERLERAELRGVLSDGMILSETELELGDDADGIMVLGEDAPAAGTLLAEALPIAETVLELELNPNRVDCMGVFGVARELHAITGAPLAPAPWETDLEPEGETDVDELASVRVEAPDLCPRFTARAFDGLTVGPSPLWLRARLAAAGQRPISNVVDVTNYVMLLIAQPLHAFDLDRVPGGELIVRRAREGETMRTLDGVERSFDAETVLVCDRDRPSGIAGIMGGAESEVSDESSRVLLEAATWNGVNILRSSTRLGLRTDASARFEKQLHPELAMRGQRIASRLLAELAGARLAPGTIDVVSESPAPRAVTLRRSRLEALLGTPIELDEAERHLARLGFDPQRAGDGELRTTVPAHRFSDVSREADLIEEVGRLHGLDRLPRTLPSSSAGSGQLGRQGRLRRRAEDALRDLGFAEIVSWHLVSPELADRLRLPQADPRRRAVRAANPISAEQSEMRTTLLGGLLDAARHNLARDRDRVALFESGRVVLAEPSPAEGGELGGRFAGSMPAPAREPHRLGCLVVGALAPGSWRRPATGDADLFDLKGVLELLAVALGAEAELVSASEPFLHPRRAASIELGGRPSGWLGELHPLVARDWDLPGGVGFELDLAALIAHAPELEDYADLTTHPEFREDIAVVVEEAVSAAAVRDAVREAGGELLAAAEVFDLYRGDQVGAGRKSVALRLSFRAPDRTLTDEEVAPLRESIRAALAGLGGTLRE